MAVNYPTNPYDQAGMQAWQDAAVRAYTKQKYGKELDARQLKAVMSRRGGDYWQQVGQHEYQKVLNAAYKSYYDGNGGQQRAVPAQPYKDPAPPPRKINKAPGGSRFTTNPKPVAQPVTPRTPEQPSMPPASPPPGLAAPTMAPPLPPAAPIPMAGSATSFSMPQAQAPRQQYGFAPQAQPMMAQPMQAQPTGADGFQPVMPQQPMQYLARGGKVCKPGSYKK